MDSSKGDGIKDENELYAIPYRVSHDVRDMVWLTVPTGSEPDAIKGVYQDIQATSSAEPIFDPFFDDDCSDTGLISAWSDTGEVSGAPAEEKREPYKADTCHFNEADVPPLPESDPCDYTISDISRYCPQRGVLVKWAPSWVDPDLLPISLYPAIFGPDPVKNPQISD